MDQLVVTSKVKAKIKEMANMNTSQETIDHLTRHVGEVLSKAIDAAKADGRKTVMGRDIKGALESNTWE